MLAIKLSQATSHVRWLTTNKPTCREQSLSVLLGKLMTGMTGSIVPKPVQPTAQNTSHRGLLDGVTHCVWFCFRIGLDFMLVTWYQARLNVKQLSVLKYSVFSQVQQLLWMLLPGCAGIVNRQLVVATESGTLTFSGGNVGPKNRFHMVSLAVFTATRHVQ